MAELKGSGDMKAAECTYCGELFAVMFVEKKNGEVRCNVCQRILSDGETKEEHIRHHHATCSSSCTAKTYIVSNKGKVGAAVGIAATPVLLPMAGFTAAGVAGGSVAAGIQSAVYGAYTAGVFSVLQSAGTGAVVATGTVMAGGAAVGGAVGKGIDTMTGRGGSKATSSPDEYKARDGGGRDNAHQKKAKTNQSAVYGSYSIVRGEKRQCYYDKS